MKWMNKVQQVAKSKLVSNTFYLMLLQVLNNILPLLTIPYLVRVLGTDNYGVIAYSQVIFTYITVVADYGFNLSTTRQFAILKNDQEASNNLFSAVLFTKLIILTACFVIFTPFMFGVSMFYTYKWVYVFSYVMALGQILFPIWFYQGIENMRVIVLLNSISKLLFTALIFVFVRRPNQLALVPLFNAAGALLIGLVGVIIAVKKYNIVLKLPMLSEVKNQLKEGFDVFIPSFFSSVINNGGIFVLGLFHSSAVVGYFSAVDKLIRAAFNLFYPISQSLFPNISQQLHVNKKQGISFIKSIGAKVIIVISICVLLGLFVAPVLLEFIYDVSYRQYAYVLNVLSVWFLVGVLNNFIGVQFMIGAGYGKTYRKAFVITGLAMLLMYTSIKLFAINGIVFSMLVGEILLTLLMVFFIKKEKLLS